MNALPVDFREILQLRVVRELPYEQIAQIMDLPVGTVKSRLARARLQLKKDWTPGTFLKPMRLTERNNWRWASDGL